MPKTSFCEKERNRIQKLNSFQLANSYKKIGHILTIIFIALIITRKLIDYDVAWIKISLKSGLLLGFLIISISKEKIEDELIQNLRAKSYRIAFVLTVAYALIQPFIEFGVGTLLNGTSEFTSSFSYFQVLIFMLIVQIGFFEQLKRLHT